MFFNFLLAYFSYSFTLEKTLFMSDRTFSLSASTVNVRSVLEYVPYFRGKLFFVHIAQSLLASSELVDALLDLDALQEIGVRIALIAEGNTTQQLYDDAVACEMRAALITDPLQKAEASLSRLQTILDRGQIPILASHEEGNFPDTIIYAAVALGAAKYIAIMEKHCVPCKDKFPIHAILESDVTRTAPTLSYGHLLEEAAHVCRQGIPRVHLLDGQRRGVLVDELFSEEGVGTMVHADSYREIRPLQEEDIPELLSMIGRSVQDAKLIARTYEDVAQRIQDYYILTLDETIVGSVAIHLYPDQCAAELACLYIKHRHEGLGYGRSLVAHVEKLAREAGMRHVFAISRSAVEFFRDRMHYNEWSRDLLPPERLAHLQESKRNSGVFAVDLN